MRASSASVTCIGAPLIASRFSMGMRGRPIGFTSPRNRLMSWMRFIRSCRFWWWFAGRWAIEVR
jgi:hypothetical protein